MPKKTYIVANPRGIPPEINGERIPIFKQGEDIYYEGDTYTGNKPAVPLERGFIVEVKHGEG